jgi:hypothetical protein
MITSDGDIENKAVVHENVVLGIPGCLNALEGWLQQRSKSALEPVCQMIRIELIRPPYSNQIKSKSS